MALTTLQRDILRLIATNRSETSYIAGGVALNVDWPRLSEDIDVFQDTDEEIGAIAEVDIGILNQAGLRVNVLVNIYGCVEAEIERDHATTLIQWMSEARTRFFPLLRDADWGARLTMADLAVNKVLAASTRRKARDYIDLLMIDMNYCPLGAVVMAASGKPPHYSPLKIVEEIRRKALSMPSQDYMAVRGIPSELTPETIREGMTRILDSAEDYIRIAPVELTGVLAVNQHSVPVMVDTIPSEGIFLRKATNEPEMMPGPVEADFLQGNT